MTASADKVQFLLQSSLQQTLPLIKKGIFSEHDLRQIMLQRQRHENKLYSSTFKLSHFLKAIEFEYDLERKRIFKIKTQTLQNGNTNPLFKKQSKTDFSIIRRIIKLWDRTMHKFRYRTYLWKQYLSFCIAINSKKHFYKALTNSLRFLPFQVQLWKIAIRYEVEVGKNRWKARKLFHKALKLIPAGQKNIKMTEQLIKFQLQFVQALQLRQNIIKGQSNEDIGQMKFIMADDHLQKDNNANDESQEQNNKTILNNKNNQSLRLREYDQIIYIALNQAIMKNYQSKTYFTLTPNLTLQDKCLKITNLFVGFLEQLKSNQQNQLIQFILQSTITKVINFKQNIHKTELSQVKNEQQMQIQAQNEQIQQKEQIQNRNNTKNHEQNYQILRQVQTSIKNKSRKQEQYELHAEQIIKKYKTNNNKFDESSFIKIIKQTCLKPVLLAQFLQPILHNCIDQALQILGRNAWLRVPNASLSLIIESLNSSTISSTPKQLKYLINQIHKINTREYESNLSLLNNIIRFNKLNLNSEQNNKLFRSLMVNCKTNIQFMQRAKCMFTQ